MVAAVADVSVAMAALELADEVRNAATPVLTSNAATLDAALRDFIRPFVEPGFEVSSTAVTDLDGKTTSVFPVVIHTPTAPKGDMIPADAVAVVVFVVEALDAQNIRDGYEAIARAKALRKTPLKRERGVAQTNRILGVIFALRSQVPLDTVAEEMRKLNEAKAAEEWPDMVAVAASGAIQYAVQFPGEGLGGDFLPPEEGALAAYTPPLYVLMTIRPTATDTVNKLLAYIVAHLAIFSSGVKLPRWDLILAGVTKTAVVVTGYQFEQAGELRPVPEEYYNDRYLAPLPLSITGPGGKALAKIQFLPWQDGGVILLSGKLPLDAFIVFLPPEAQRRVKTFRLKHHEISSALPITDGVFNKMLGTFQRQSNMRVRPDDRRFVIQKVRDEGSRSPFMTRLLIGPLRLRDVVFPDPNSRGDFDKAYDFATSALFTARAARQKIDAMWEDHVAKVTSGQIARSDGPHIKIDESIEHELREEFETFLNAAVRALKYGMQVVAAKLGVDIGFLFKQSGAFEKGVLAMAATDPHLAEYLRQARFAWTEALLERRNSIEHDGWMLPAPKYVRTGAGIQVVEPLISGRPAREFVAFTFDRLTCFVEEVTSHCLQRRFPADVTITEIAPPNRNAQMPERFQVTPATGGLPRWQITYHASSFEQT
jgi:hypothetical protein